VRGEKDAVKGGREGEGLGGKHSMKETINLLLQGLFIPREEGIGAGSHGGKRGAQMGGVPAPPTITRGSLEGQRKMKGRGEEAYRKKRILGVEQCS